MPSTETTIETLKWWSQILLWITISLPVLGAAAAGVRYYVDRYEKRLSAEISSAQIQHAVSEASEARQGAIIANEAQARLTTELAQSKEEIARISGDTLQLRQRAQPRAISGSGRESFLAVLKPFAGRQLAVEAIGGDHEAMSLAKTLFERFREAGLLVPSFPGAMIGPDTWSGIEVEAPAAAPAEFVDAIVRSLKALDLDAKRSRGRGSVVKVRVGVK